LFIPLLGAAILVGFGLRALAAGPSDLRAEEVQDLSPYEVAYLAGGAKGAAHASIASLLHTASLSIGTTDLKRNRPLANGHPLERAAYAAVDADDGETVERVALAVQSATDPLAERLQTLGLVPTEAGARRARLLSALPVALVLLLGVAKILVGLSRDKPVQILFFLCIGAALAMFLFINHPPPRTIRGSRALVSIRAANPALKATARSASDRLDPNDLVLAMGLFGLAVLSDGPLEKLRTVLRPPGSASGSGCGSGGCGGGCGGGGCGGCGG
jgi:uncharacterized protein (TIGR04222 family)